MDETKHRWYGFVARHVHFIVPFGIGTVTGSFGAVFVGATSDKGVPLSVYLGLLTAVFAAGIAVFSSWALATRTDTLQRRRQANLAVLHIRALRMEWQLIHQLLDTITGDAWTDDQIRRGYNVLVVLSKTAEQVPDFEGLLEDEEDIKHAHMVRDIFAFTRRRYAPPEDLGIRKRSWVEKRFRDRYGAVWVGMQVEGLQAAEWHFQGRI